ncbi:MAG: ATP:corrinoid adenosyltransferase BtuR/CobO/CobP [Berkelbacteria bacterium GW2011_GWB1_38_5]|uniref:ATP:corrinoid adenosyltransferase BtuR/CobO/CobP n=2 Tax=Candidatus Berkelbacteria TaxID=1618330 RepID=A0A0G0PNI3_9BACT|nr:MAG: ATP:corrinoid adenosyltransferase BtuR/CobO/CobP [Berkelbacteria bacterium GW2011_GWB1_38_5]KKQ90881.1 MAG: ATP:corrinoid adenosyltransferase BtuR/CobO/CobP [Berkelbacteria bacterium GW2011_GWA1_39_10]
MKRKNGSRSSVVGKYHKIHIYTGDGKGKTTAALGLALRAIGADKKVAIIQFMKKGNFSEHKTIEKYKLPILIESFGIGYYKILGDKKPKRAHQKAAQKALERTKELIAKGEHDIIILDEINVAIGFGLVDIEEVISIFQSSVVGKRSADIVLTGRRTHPKLKKIADLVTEMKKIKHYFDNGTKARKGIEY